MSKKKKNKKERKTFIPERKQNTSLKTVKASETKSIESETSEAPAQIKKEIKKNLLFLTTFTFILVGIYLLLTQTSMLNPVLSFFGMKDLY